MAKKSKKYLEAAKLVDKKKQYTVEEAAELSTKLNYTKFVPSIDIAIKTFANPKYNDQNLRATTSLPHGNGKTVRVAVYTTEDKVADMKKAGADIAGGAEVLSAIEKGEFNFDVLVTSPDLMKDLARVAKALGPKGLMPNPKAGTVAIDLVSAVSEIKKGRFEFKLDKTGNIHATVGKANFSPTQLAENITAFIAAVNSHKPTGVKGKLIKKAVLSPTMGPGIAISL
jgi:large subunit ribosomal protein L1